LNPVLASRIDRGLSSKAAARSAQVALSSDGRFLHLQDGPIDLIVSADGQGDCVRAAYRAAAKRFDGLLDELCEELACLRKQAEPNCTPLIGKVARRMHSAVAPFAAAHFITPMAAVAGAVAEEILEAMTKAADLDRAYVNNGGDIAYHLVPGESYSVGLIDRPDRPSLAGRVVIHADGPVRGIATSGRHGRSFSLGIADSVTVLAGTAAQADAAATIIANAVDLPDHPGVVRCRAREIQLDSDLGERLVTRDVANLSITDVGGALDAGVQCASAIQDAGLIEAAFLRLEGRTRIVAAAMTSAQA
jgi:ApbE superfamily uncharacterized protein (UPF0280 family)